MSVVLYLGKLDFKKYNLKTFLVFTDSSHRLENLMIGKRNFFGFKHFFTCECLCQGVLWVQQIGVNGADESLWLQGVSIPFLSSGTQHGTQFKSLSSDDNLKSKNKRKRNSCRVSEWRVKHQK